MCVEWWFGSVFLSAPGGDTHAGESQPQKGHGGGLGGGDRSLVCSCSGGRLELRSEGAGFVYEIPLGSRQREGDIGQIQQESYVEGLGKFKFAAVALLSASLDSRVLDLVAAAPDEIERAVFVLKGLGVRGLAGDGGSGDGKGDPFRRIAGPGVDVADLVPVAVVLVYPILP